MSEQLDALPAIVRSAKSGTARKSVPTQSEPDLLREISGKLDRLIAVVAAQGQERDRQVEILSAAGCDSNFVGSVVGMTGPAVRKFLSRQRAKAAPALADESAPEES